MGTSITYRKLLLIVALIFSQWTYAQNDTYFALPPLLEWEREGMDLHDANKLYRNDFNLNQIRRCESRLAIQ